MAANHVLLQQVTLNTSASSVTLSSIPQTGYTDLKLALTLRTDTGDSSIRVYFNNDTTATNYPRIRLIGEGTSGTSSSSASDGITIFGNSSTTTSNVFCNAEVYIPNYTSSNVKSFSTDSVMENNANYAIDGLFAAKWTGTSAITSISIVTGGSNLVAGSTVSLYGIAAVGTTPTVVPKASGGDIVVNDGTYWYHAFLSSGTFTPQTTLSCNALIVAGGAGANMGGGGAGGLLGVNSFNASSTAYSIIVGAGGAAGTSTGGGAANGGDSTCFGYTATGGGRSGIYGQAGFTGASSGGSGGTVTTQTAVSGTGLGNVGGGGYGAAGGDAGGGGGAGSAGGNGTSGGSGGGGAGLNTYSSWATATGTGASGYYAGGGAGGLESAGTAGTAGAGGGGAAGSTRTSNGTAGTINTGGGGGGAGSGGATPGHNGGAGGSGIVIIRYAMA